MTHKHCIKVNLPLCYVNTSFAFFSSVYYIQFLITTNCHSLIFLLLISSINFMKRWINELMNCYMATAAWQPTKHAEIRIVTVIVQRKKYVLCSALIAQCMDFGPWRTAVVQAYWVWWGGKRCVCNFSVTRSSVQREQTWHCYCITDSLLAHHLKVPTAKTSHQIVCYTVPFVTENCYQENFTTESIDKLPSLLYCCTFTVHTEYYK